MGEWVNLNLGLLILAGLASGLAQVVSKGLVKSGHRATSYTTAIMLVNAVLCLPLLIIDSSLPTSWQTWLLVVLSVVSFALSSSFGFLAYRKTDVSLVAIVQRLNLLVVAVLGVWWLKEGYTTANWLGLGLIVVGGILVVIKKGKLELETGIKWALLMALTGAMATVLDKVVLSDFSPYSYALVNNLLTGLVFLGLKGRAREVVDLIKNQWRGVGAAAILTTIAFVLVLLVLQRTPVSQTMPVAKSLSLIVPVVLGIGVLKETQGWGRKLAGAMLMVMGITLQY